MALGIVGIFDVATALVAGIKCFASFDARQRIAAEEMGMKLVGGST